MTLRIVQTITTEVRIVMHSNRVYYYQDLHTGKPVVYMPLSIRYFCTNVHLNTGIHVCVLCVDICYVSLEITAHAAYQLNAQQLSTPHPSV